MQQVVASYGVASTYGRSVFCDFFVDGARASPVHDVVTMWCTFVLGLRCLALDITASSDSKRRVKEPNALHFTNYTLACTMPLPPGFRTCAVQPVP